MEERIYDITDRYINEFKDKHNKNVEEYFQELTKKSRLDVQDNNKTVKEYNEAENLSEKTHKKITALKVIGIIQGVLLGILAIVFIAYLALKRTSVDGIEEMSAQMGFVAIPIVAISLLVTFSILIAFKVKKLNKVFDENKKIAKERFEKAVSQMQPLNDLFETHTYQKLFTKTWSMITFDPVFDSKKFELMCKKYGLYDNKANKNRSALYVQSGHINGSPFMISRVRGMKMVDHVYTGSLTISWSEYNGKEWVTRSETLYASLTKPVAKYDETNSIVFASEAMPNLSFSRRPNLKNLSAMNEKKYEKYIHKQEKELNKYSERQMKAGRDFTPLSNTEFEIIFGALNRDNEHEFRMFATPQTQVEMKKLIVGTKEGIPYDDFNFEKYKMLTKITTGTLQKTDISSEPSDFSGYDYEEVKRRFIKLNNEYFYGIYFAFAPILAVNAYQDTKPAEYIYKDVYGTKFCNWQHEAIVNAFPRSDLAHSDCKTKCILKTEPFHTNKYGDGIKATAYGFNIIPRVTEISVYGGDGNYHLVPVYWDEYIPVEKTTTIGVMESQLTIPEYRNIMNENEDSKKILKKCTSAMSNSLFALLFRDEVSDSEVGKTLKSTYPVINKVELPKIETLDDLKNGLKKGDKEATEEFEDRLEELVESLDTDETNTVQ